MAHSIIAPEIKEILKSENSRVDIKKLFDDIHPYDIFSLCESLENSEIAEIVISLGIPTGIELFEEFDEEHKVEIFKCFSHEWMADILEEMAPDERADFVKYLPKQNLEDVLPLMARAERIDIKKLIEYKEGTAGAMLTTEYATVPLNMTAKEAIEKIKEQAFDSETIYYIYIVDENRKLLGFVSLRDILIAHSHQKVESIMNANVISGTVHEDAELITKKIQDYGLLAIPIVDNDQRLVGIVTVDDAVDTVIEETTEDIYKYGGVEEYIDYMKANSFHLAQQRTSWLLILIFVGFFSSWVLEKNSLQLESVVALSFFIPLLLGAGGNAGTQSSTVVIRGLSTGAINLKDIVEVFKKEFFVGVMVGSVMAMIVGLRALWVGHGDPRLGITVGVSMVFSVMLATTLGALLPMLFKKLKWDPALMSGPFITSIVDIVSLLVYFRIALIIFK